MEKVKEFFNVFAKDEAHAGTLAVIPDLKAYNNAVEKMYNHTTRLLRGSLSWDTVEELDDDDFYEMYEGFDPDIPRHLFKISHYKHAKYKDVWILYCSNKGPSLDYKVLDTAFFIVEEKGKLLIVKKYDYSDFESDGYEYKWEETFGGYKGLTFQSLGELVRIERYLAPKKHEMSIKLYLEEK